MAIIKKFSPYQNLTNYQTFLVDDNPNSDYFRITELNETLTGGKNGFLIEGSSFLKETTEIKIEILDVEGNPLYFEPGDGTPEYYEGLSSLVAIHVYTDTPIGIGKITILGELKDYKLSGGIVPIPTEWSGVYNVKWERDIKINKLLANEDKVRFYKRPEISISELVKPIFTKTIPTVTQEGEAVGIPQIPNQGTNLTDWGAGTSYRLRITDTNYWTSSVDENEITIPSLDYTTTIREVLNNRELLVDTPYSVDNVVQYFNTASYSTTFEDNENTTTTQSALTGSFAVMDMSNLKTFVGDVARVKIYRKSRNDVGDYQFVQETKLESTELLRDLTIQTDTDVSYGNFSVSNLETYWTSSSNNHPVTFDPYILNDAVKVDYDNVSGGIQSLTTNDIYSISSDVEYTVSFKAMISGSVSTDKILRAYLSSSTHTQDFIEIEASNEYLQRTNVSENIIAENTDDMKLVFEFTGDDWYISNVSLRNAQETSFSPDEFNLIQDVPRKLPEETFDFRFEFYDINNNYIPVDVSTSHTFVGGNLSDASQLTKYLTLDANRSSFRFITGSIGNPAFQQIGLSVDRNLLSETVIYGSSSFDSSGNYIDPLSYSGQYPGLLTNVSDTGATITISNFTGSDSSVIISSIVYTASCEDFIDYETIYRFEDGESIPLLIVTSDANQFIYEPTELALKPTGQSINIRVHRKNLASFDTPITANSSSDIPLTEVSDLAGVKLYNISGINFPYETGTVTYSFTGSDQFDNPYSDEVTISPVLNFDGVSVVLTNEATSFPSLSTGYVNPSAYSSGNGFVQLSVGSSTIGHDDYTGDSNQANNTFDVVSITGSNCTPLSTEPTDNVYGISDMNIGEDTANLEIAIKYKAGEGTEVDFIKTVNYTKAKNAVPNVLISAIPLVQTVNTDYLGSGSSIPVDIEISATEGNIDIFNYIGDITASAELQTSIVGNTISFTNTASEMSGSVGTLEIPVFYTDSEGTNGSTTIIASVNKSLAGNDAKTVKLSTPTYIVRYDIGETNPSPSGSIEFTATAQNFITPHFKFSVDNIDVSSSYTASGDNDETYLLDIPDNYFSVPINVRVGVSDEMDAELERANDNFNVFALKPGDTGGGSEFWYIKPLTGTQLKNNSGSLELQAIHISGSSITELTSGDVTLYDGNTQLSVDAGNLEAGTNGVLYNPIFYTGGITGSKTISLKTSGGDVLDTITILDVTDGLAGGSIISTNLRTRRINSGTLHTPIWTYEPANIPVTASFFGTNGTEYTSSLLISASYVDELDKMYYELGYTDGNISMIADNGDGTEFVGEGVGNILTTKDIHLSFDFIDPQIGTINKIQETFYIVSDGQDGDDAYTVFLTNSPHSFPVTDDGTAEGTVTPNDLLSGSFEVRLFKGTSQYTFDDSIPYATDTYRVLSAIENGISVSVSTVDNQLKYTPTAVTGDSGTVTITIVDNETDVELPLVYSFSKIQSGTDAMVVKITSPTYVVVYDSEGNNPTPTGTMFVTASAQNFYTPYFKFTIDGVDETVNYEIGTGNTDTYEYTIPSTYFDTPVDIKVGVSDIDDINIERAFDNITITSIKPGHIGDSSEFYYIKPLTGTQLKNNSGSLEIQAVYISGSTTTDITLGNYKLYDGDTVLVEDAGNLEAGTNSVEYNAVFYTGGITGSKVISLKDDSLNILDTITLLDVTDGISGGTVGAKSLYTRRVNIGVNIGTLDNPEYEYEPANIPVTASFFGTDGLVYSGSVLISASYDDINEVDEIHFIKGNIDPLITMIANDGDGVEFGPDGVLGWPTSETLATKDINTIFTFFDPQTDATTTIQETFYIVSDGMDGMDAYTVYLTNESHTFPADETGSVADIDEPYGAFEIRLFRGDIQYTYDTTGVGTYSIESAVSSGIELTPSTVDNQLKYTPTDVIDDAGNAVITILDNTNSNTFEKTYTFSKSTNGATGVNATSVTLTSPNYIITYDENGDLVSPSSNFFLTASVQNIDTPWYEFTGDQITEDIEFATGNTTEFSVPATFFDDVKNIRVGASDGDQTELTFDTISIVGVKPGIDGDDAYTVLLTNEAHVLPTTNTGIVTYTDSGTDILVYKGTSQLTAVIGTPTTGQFSVTAAVTSGTITIGNQSPAGTFGVHSGMTTNYATITYTINVENLASFTKKQSLSKSIEGTDGETGGTGADGLNAVSINIIPATQVVTIDETGVSGSVQSFDVTVIEAGTIYTYSETLENETFRISSVVNGTNVTGTITPNNPPDASGLTVTFDVEYRDSVGTPSAVLPYSHTVTMALDGTTGPGVVMTGIWDTDRIYQFSTGVGARRDVVLWSTIGTLPYDTYYATLQEAGTTIDAPHIATSYWESLGQDDFFVAAKIAIFEESYIQNTLNIGTNNNGGVSSANITLYGSGSNPYISIGQANDYANQLYDSNGIWIGNDAGSYKMSLVGINGALKWTGTNLEVSGSVIATDGSIGGITLAEGKLYTGTGNFGSNDTEFYVDDTGQFSLKDKLTWDGTVLEISGSISASLGEIGGWTIDTDSMYTGTKDAAGYTTTGITLSANGSLHSPNFYISSTGDAFFNGSITSTVGNIGGWVIDADSMYTGTKDAAGYTTTGITLSSDGSLHSPTFYISNTGDAFFSGSIEGGTIDIGNGSFTVDSDGNVDVESSINVANFGDITIGTNGSFTAGGFYLTNTVFQLAQGVTDIQDDANDVLPSYLYFSNNIGGTDDCWIKAHKNVNYLGETTSIELNSLSAGEHNWLVSGSSANMMTLEDSGDLRVGGDVYADGVLLGPSAGGTTTFNVDGDNTDPQIISQDNTLLIAGGTGLSSVASSVDTITINLDNTGVTADPYTNANITIDAQGRITAASSGTDTTYSVFTTTTDGLVPSSSASNTTDYLRRDGTWAEPVGGGDAYNWSIQTDDQASTDVPDGFTVDFTGGTGISTVYSSSAPTQYVTINVTDGGIGSTQLNVTGDGTTSQYLRSDGDGSFSWATPSTGGTGDITRVDITAGTGLTGDLNTLSGDHIQTINHLSYVTAGTISGGSGTLTYGGTFTVPSVTYNAQGHITSTTTTSYTLPASDNTNTQNIFTSSWVDSTADVLLRLTKSGASSGTQDIKMIAGTNITLTPSGTDLTIASSYTNTTYGISAVGAAPDARIRLTDSNSTTDDVTLAAGDNITIGTVGDTITINAASATTATDVTLADESSDTTCNVVFATAATGDLPLKTGTNLTFNSSTGELYPTSLKVGQTITSNGTAFIVGTASAGTVYLRPDGVASATAQSTFSTTLASIGTNLSVAGTITSTDSTASTSTTTGALKVTGGVGVGGAIFSGGNMNAPDFVGTSDITLKENIIPITASRIDTNYINFNFKDDETKQKRTGLIAQELQKSHPEFVREDGSGILSISYIDVHSAEIAYLKDENNNLNNKIDELTKLVQTLIKQ